MIAFGTVLSKRKNRETSISYGIGHGGIEVMMIMGITFIQNIIYSVMINTGAFAAIVKLVESQAPEQTQTLYTVAAQLAAFSAGDLCISVAERIFAVMFHVGASILVFYACRDKDKIVLYPLAILLHTLLDGTVGLQMAGVLNITPVMLEAVVCVFGTLTFFGAYLLLYRKEESNGICRHI